MEKRTTKTNLKGKEVKMMKKILLVLMAIAMIATFGTMAQADTIQFNDTNLGWITVGSFDWTVGNALTDNLVSGPPPPGPG